MIEIEVDGELFHPPTRVWQALADAEVVGRWFADVEVPSGALAGPRLSTGNLPGFEAAVDVSVLDRQPPRRLAMRWHEAGRRSEVTCTVTPTSAGCRLTVREVLEYGAWSTTLRTDRERCYQQALGVRLPAILDWLAFREVDLRAGDAVGGPEVPGGAPAGPAVAARSRRRWATIAVAAAGTLAAGVALWALAPADPRPAGALADPAPTLSAGPSDARPSAVSAPSRPTTGATSRAARPRATPTKSATPSPSVSASPAVRLTARYETSSKRILGWTGEVEVTNPGTTPAAWTVVVTLARDAAVVDADGATWRQEGEEATFSGPPVPAGGSMTFTFDVRGTQPAGPEACRVGEAACTGV
ncbi:SRPBCC domain-containing protein [Micromonospora sp. NPDC047707]|uniref:SRPBCC domain-containing protein n=1 Tax=Micromonospora sp. NPDC047707 TaxID=3154498 RepID=UPI00345737D2